MLVATALTVYGIETLGDGVNSGTRFMPLQQLLPFTVLKPWIISSVPQTDFNVATAPTVYGIETDVAHNTPCPQILRCNSAYRLQY